MKALVIASILFFSLRAMSAEEGENKKSECLFADQGKREAKVVAPVESEPKKENQSRNRSK